MTDTPEDRVDLTPLGSGADLRASRITARVAERVAAARRAEAGRSEMWDGVRRRLARLAIPGTLAAAASLAAVLTTDGSPDPRAEPFALVVLGAGPATRWIALDRPPEISELVAVLRGMP
jgi:hypothetical protein